MINHPIVIGHRGACGYTPENTLASLAKARALGISWVEFDVMLTGCGEAIVMHDNRLDRTTNGRGEIAEWSYAEIVKLDAGSWFGAEFAGERVPTFKQALQCLKHFSLSAVIEIKPYPGREVATASKVVEIFELCKADELASVIVSSFSITSLQVARAASSKLNLAFTVDRLPKGWEAIATELKCGSIHLDQQTLTKEQVTEIKKQGYKVFSYTVNDPERAAILFSWGVDAVFSDYPDLISPLCHPMVDF